MATGGVYYPGTLVRLTGTFTVDGEPTDPTTVECIVRDPEGGRTVYVYGQDDELQKVETGVYQLELTPDKPKRWYYAFKGTGAAQATAEATFTVRETKAL